MLQFRHACFDRFRYRHRVTAVRQLHGHTGSGFTVQAGRRHIGFLTKFDTGDIFQAHGSAAFGALQDDIFKFGDVAQLAGDVDNRRETLPRQGRQRAEAAGRDRAVLRGNRGGYVSGREVIAAQFFRIEPNAHRGFRAEEADAANTVDPLQFRDDITLGVVAHFAHGQAGIIAALQGNDHEEVGTLFADSDAVLRHRAGQAGRHLRHGVLHVDLGDVFIGAGDEGQRQRAAAAGIGGCFHVVEAVDAVHLAFHDGEHGFFNFGGTRARIADANGDFRRANVRILLNRQALQGKQAGDNDKYRDNPGENGAVNEKLGHIPPVTARPVFRLTAWRAWPQVCHRQLAAWQAGWWQAAAAAVCRRHHR